MLYIYKFFSPQELILLRSLSFLGWFMMVYTCCERLGQQIEEVKEVRGNWM